MQQFPKKLQDQIAESGIRFTHHSSIAPTGTISLSLANNASNGIEPSFAHHYSRNVIREGKKSKEKVDVFSFELLAYRHLVNQKAMPFSDKEDEKLPEYFIDSSTIKAKAHVDIQAASQKWIDSSISKTINVPTDYDYEDFKNIYLYAYEKGLKGCTTFRFNPEAFQGVLVTEKDLEETTYEFTLDDGVKIEVKGKRQHPLYTWLCDKDKNGKSNSTVKWNFQKYLLDEKGFLVDYFYSTTKPMSTKITSVIQ